MMRNREGGKPKFIGFILVVEQKSTTASDYAEVTWTSLGDTFTFWKWFIFVFEFAIGIFTD